MILSRSESCHPAPLAIVLTIMLSIASGCERATRAIDRDQTRIERLARQTIGELDESRASIAAAMETGAVGSSARPLLDGTLRHHQTAIRHQHDVLRIAGRTRSRLPDVEDRAQPLVRLAQTWGSVALIVAVIALLAYLGIGPIIRRMFHLFGLLIPRAVRCDAKFDAEALVQGKACDLDHQRIAARRAADRCYDRAFRDAKNRIERPGSDVSRAWTSGA